MEFKGVDSANFLSVLVLVQIQFCFAVSVCLFIHLSFLCYKSHINYLVTWRSILQFLFHVQFVSTGFENDVQNRTNKTVNDSSLCYLSIFVALRIMSRTGHIRK